MQVESYYPFLLAMAPFAFAFLAEALVIYLFRLKHLGAALGVGVLINVLSLAVLYGSGLLLGKMGYAINGLQLPVPVFLFFWWAFGSDGWFIAAAFYQEQHHGKNLFLLHCDELFFLAFFVFVHHVQLAEKAARFS